MPLSTRDTVAGETLARAATSVMVVLGMMFARLRLTLAQSEF
jgi:hypothetical protein